MPFKNNNNLLTIALVPLGNNVTFFCDVCQIIHNEIYCFVLRNNDEVLLKSMG